MKNYKLSNLYGNKASKSEKVFITERDPHIQSMAALIIFKKFLFSIDEQYKSKDLNYKIWLRFRNKWLRRQKKIHGSLTCYFCKSTNLNANIFSPNVLHDNKKATIDHFKPLSKGGSKYNDNNLVVCCLECNQKKADNIVSR